MFKHTGYGKLLATCLFVGLMIGTAVRAVVPAVTLVTAPVMCDGKSEVDSSWYKCVDGKPRVAQDGAPEMPSIYLVILLTTLFYGGGLFLIAAIAKALTGRRDDKQHQAMD